jgi:diadenosine tetraphosphatase ApaH/serine/threonine PP2A family protein phosphatase
VRLLLLSDIHANGVALETVLADAEARKFDRVVCLGDALGYGPHPRQVLDTLRELEAVCVVGNHEEMLLALHDQPNPGGGVVSQALRWQLTQLSERDISYVRAWKDGIDDSQLGARYRHGTPTSLDGYIDSVTAAREVFAQWHGKLGFVGHTHVPSAYSTLNGPSGEWVRYQAFVDGGSYMVPPSARVILNPGSVGQPRDGNPQASYGLYDTARNNFQVFRVAYDVPRAREAFLQAGLPEVLGARLVVGK